MTSLVSAGLGIWQTYEQKSAQEDAQNKAQKAQKEQQAKLLKAQEEARRDSAARTPKQMHEREFAASATNNSLRGIQATMLASRKAQNADGGGKTKLGE